MINRTRLPEPKQRHRTLSAYHYTAAFAAMLSLSPGAVDASTDQAAHFRATLINPGVIGEAYFHVVHSGLFANGSQYYFAKWQSNALFLISSSRAMISVHSNVNPSVAALHSFYNDRCSFSSPDGSITTLTGFDPSNPSSTPYSYCEDMLCPVILYSFPGLDYHHVTWHGNQFETTVRMSHAPVLCTLQLDASGFVESAQYVITGPGTRYLWMLKYFYRDKSSTDVMPSKIEVSAYFKGRYRKVDDIVIDKITRKPSLEGNDAYRIEQFIEASVPVVRNRPVPVDEYRARLPGVSSYGMAPLVVFVAAVALSLLATFCGLGIFLLQKQKKGKL